MSAPAVAVAKDGGKFVVAWKDVRTGEPNIYWAMSTTPSFAKGSLVHETTRGVQDHPSVCLDSDGTAIIAWEDSRDGKKRIWYRTSQAGSNNLAVSDPEESPASYPVVAVKDHFVAIVYEAGTKTRQVRFRTVR